MAKKNASPEAIENLRKNAEKEISDNIWLQDIPSLFFLILLYTLQGIFQITNYN